MRRPPHSAVAVVLACLLCSACRKSPTPTKPEPVSTTGASSAPAPATKALDETVEPKLGFVVRVGTAEIQLGEDEQAPVVGSFSSPTVSVRVKPERSFGYAGVSFAYPRHFTFEADLSSDAHSWTLSGNDVKIMVFRFTTEIAVEDFTKELAEGYGKETTITSTTRRLGDAEYSGKRVHARIAGQGIVQDVLVLPALKGRSRLLVLQDFGEGTKQETTSALALLAQSFRVSR
jgi:hypothetical protein